MPSYTEHTARLARLVARCCSLWKYRRIYECAAVSAKELKEVDEEAHVVLSGTTIVDEVAWLSYYAGDGIEVEVNC